MDVDGAESLVDDACVVEKRSSCEAMQEFSHSPVMFYRYVESDL